jgi:hypothetical protein
MFGCTYIVSTLETGFSFIYELWDSSGALPALFYSPHINNLQVGAVQWPDIPNGQT